MLIEEISKLLSKRMPNIYLKLLEESDILKVLIFKV